MSLLKIIEHKNSVLQISLNRVDKHNALSRSLLSEFIFELEKAFKEALEHKIKALIISSESIKAFCAGADLKERLNMNESEIVETLDELKKMTLLLEDFPVPTLAVIDGVAFGGGLEMALSCDLRLCSEKAVLALTETKLAIIPGAGGTQRLARIVGIGRAKELIYRAKKINSEEAYSYGLSNYSGLQPLEEALTWAEEIAKAGPLAIQAAKQAIDQGIHLPIEEALLVEREAYLKTLHSKDRVEALKAFVEKREAQFVGA